LAHTASAKKRIHQNLKRRSRNRWRKSQVQAAIKEFEQALRDGDRAKAAEQLQVCYKKLDQVAAKGTIHRNTAARKKSRLAKRLTKATG
jgi:small subunit ribosomal protein S20